MFSQTVLSQVLLKSFSQTIITDQFEVSTFPEGCEKPFLLAPVSCDYNSLSQGWVTPTTIPHSYKYELF